MKPLFMLFVAEACLRHLDREAISARVTVSAVKRLLERENPSLFGDTDYGSLRTAMRILFPIYKNRRRRTRVFKIRAKEAYKYAQMKRMRFRPLAHIQQKGMPHAS